MSLPPDTGYLHRSGHSWHLGRPLVLTPAPIPARSDEQYVAELEERMRRLREESGDAR